MGLIRGNVYSFIDKGREGKNMRLSDFFIDNLDKPIIFTSIMG